MSMPRSSWGFLAVAVLAGAALSPPAEAQALAFYNLSPCRAVDTRSSGYGGILVGSAIRSFQMKGVCGVPADAKTVTLNVTAVGPTCGGFFVVYPAGAAIPAVSNLNFNAGEPAIANGAVVPVSSGSPDISLIYGVGGGVCTAHAVFDVTGYFK